MGDLFLKRDFIERKKGEITANQIVTLALAIIGFIIVVILLFSLEFNTLQDEEVCRLSVLTRATSPESVQGQVPLKCTTGKICLTDGKNGGECEQFTGEEYVQTVKLSGSVEEMARTIERVNADTMLKCWSMMGEGKLNIFPGNDAGFVESLVNGGNLRSKSTSCVICDRVALDKDFVYVRDEDGKLGEEFSEDFKKVALEVDINEYMRTRSPGSIEGTSKNYYELMSDDRVRSYPKEFSVNLVDGNKSEGGIDLGERKADEIEKAIDQRAYVFMQINTEEDPWDSFGETTTGTFIAGETLLYSVGGLKALGSVPAQTAVAVGSLGSGGVAAWKSAESRQVSATYCGDFVYGDTSEEKDKKARKGCSLILPLDYDNIEEVNNYCSVIEGSP